MIRRQLSGSKHQTLLASHNEQREKEEEQYSGTSCGITIWSRLLCVFCWRVVKQEFCVWAILDYFHIYRTQNSIYKWTLTAPKTGIATRLIAVIMNGATTGPITMGSQQWNLGKILCGDIGTFRMKIIIEIQAHSYSVLLLSLSICGRKGLSKNIMAFHIQLTNIN